MRACMNKNRLIVVIFVLMAAAFIGYMLYTSYPQYQMESYMKQASDYNTSALNLDDEYQNYLNQKDYNNAITIKQKQIDYMQKALAADSNALEIAKKSPYKFNKIYIDYLDKDMRRIAADIIIYKANLKALNDLQDNKLTVLEDAIYTKVINSLSNVSKDFKGQENDIVKSDPGMFSFLPCYFKIPTFFIFGQEIHL